MSKIKRLQMIRKALERQANLRKRFTASPQVLQTNKDFDGLRERFKNVNLDIKLEAGSKYFLYKISDESEDRHGDSIEVKGWDTSTFEKSGAVLFAHDQRSPPVQTALNVIKTSDGLYSVAQPLERGIYEFADMISDMVERGYIKMTSVGFIPFDYEVKEGHEDDWWPPLLFKKQELTEYSIVPVGSNRSAFIEDMPEHEKALDLFVEQTLDEDEAPQDVKDFAEGMRSKEKTHHVVTLKDILDNFKKLS